LIDPKKSNKSFDFIWNQSTFWVNQLKTFESINVLSQSTIDSFGPFDGIYKVQTLEWKWMLDCAQRSTAHNFPLYVCLLVNQLSFKLWNVNRFSNNLYAHVHGWRLYTLRTLATFQRLRLIIWISLLASYIRKSGCSVLRVYICSRLRSLSCTGVLLHHPFDHRIDRLE